MGSCLIALCELSQINHKQLHRFGDRLNFSFYQFCLCPINTSNDVRQIFFLHYLWFLISIKPTRKKGVMIQKIKTAKMFFSYVMLTDSSLVTVKITVVALVVYQK